MDVASQEAVAPGQVIIIWSMDRDLAKKHCRLACYFIISELTFSENAENYCNLLN